MSKSQFGLKGRRTNGKPMKYEGLPLVDAGEDVSVVITPADVKHSRKKDPANCAAALAGRRSFNTDVRVYMTRTYVKDEKRKRWVRFITPMNIQKEIVSFDRGAEFEPGEYKFKAPTASSSLGYKAEYGGGNSTRTGKKRAIHHTANVRVHARSDMTKTSK